MSGHYELQADIAAIGSDRDLLPALHHAVGDPVERPDRLAAIIGGRYRGAERAEEFGERNGVPGELLVRLHPTKVIAGFDVAD